MGRLLVVLICLLSFSSLSCAGDWKVIDRHTLRFEGSIKIDDISKFNVLFTEDIKTLIVTSGGGDVLAAIPIAESMQRQHVDIVVDGICASSCANYFFIAANKKKVTQESLLLFHGGITPMLENKGKMVEEMTNAGAGPEQIESYFKAWQDGAAKEHALYNKAGVDMALLDYSHRVTNEDYDFWAPPLATLENLGVKDITEFWYPASDEVMTVLAMKIRHKYGKNKSSNSTRMSILSGDIEQWTAQ